MACKHVIRTRDNLVTALMRLETKRDDLYMRSVWDCFQHFLTVYHMNQNVRRIARDLPTELREKLAA